VFLPGFESGDVGGLMCPVVEKQVLAALLIIDRPHLAYPKVVRNAK